VDPWFDSTCIHLATIHSKNQKCHPFCDNSDQKFCAAELVESKKLNSVAGLPNGSRQHNCHATSKPGNL
jgi:hypothetical protein